MGKITRFKDIPQLEMRNGSYQVDMDIKILRLLNRNRKK